MPGKPTQTISDIARLANVSRSTVSRALNDSPLIPPKTRERIRAIARQTNFRLNATARRLSLGQSRTIAFVIHSSQPDFTVADLFVLEMLGSISQGLHDQGYDMLVVRANANETAWAHETLDSGRADGFILLTSAEKQRHIQTLLDMRAPFIVWGVPPQEKAMCSVSGDNSTGGRQAAGRLVSTGRRRIAFLGGPAEEPEMAQRLSGFREALAESEIWLDPHLTIHQEYSAITAGAATQYLLDQAPDLDGIFVYSDTMAITAMNTLRSQGRRIPEDVAVVGYDDLSIAQFSQPPLTTIRQSIPKAGLLLASQLIQHLQTGSITNTTLPVELIVRQSA